MQNFEPGIVTSYPTMARGRTRLTKIMGVPDYPGNRNL
jgi:hypothetical protein